MRWSRFTSYGLWSCGSGSSKDAPGIHVAFVRVFRLSTPWILSELPAYGGCRSWVNLPVLPGAIGRKAVLGDAEHQDRTERVKKILGLVGVD